MLPGDNLELGRRHHVLDVLVFWLELGEVAEGDRGDGLHAVDGVPGEGVCHHVGFTWEMLNLVGEFHDIAEVSALPWRPWLSNPEAG